LFALQGVSQKERTKMEFFRTAKAKEARRRASRHIPNLPKSGPTAFTVEQLLRLCHILGADTRRRVKGGEWKEFSEEKLARSIRSVIGRGTFPDRLMRFADMADEFVEQNSFSPPKATHP
jgi:hypothetical protein